jgi:hypothetical protein
MTLWDEEGRRLVGFRDLKGIRKRLGEPPGESAPITPTKPDVVPRAWR